MTVATYTSDLADIFLFQTTTGVSAYGGGASGLGTGADFAMEGTLAVDKQITSAEKGFMYDNVSNFTIGADDHFFIWVMGATPGICDTRNNRGIVGCIGDSTTAFVKFHLNGSDTLPLGGGQPYALRFVNTTLTNFRTLVGTPGTTPSWIGGGLNTTATAKAANLGVDGARIGTGYDVLNGTGADPEANFAGIAADDEGTSEGVFQTSGAGYLLQGKIRIGSAATACEFLDSDVSIVLRDTRHSLTDFSEILLENAASILTLTRVTFQPLGTNNPGRFEMLTSAATANLTSCSFIDWGVTILGTGATFLNCTWINCDLITANGGDLTGSEVTGYEGTADTAALLWDVATDPDGLLDDMSFTKGTAATHAIEFGTSALLTQTIRGMTSSGYNAVDGNNDSTFLFADRGSDVTWTLNVVGGSGNFSFKKARAGDTVTIVVDPVTTLITIKDSADVNIRNAQVLVEARDGTDDLPFDETVTIARSGTTATVTHATHGLVTGDKVTIRGCEQQQYNGVHEITVLTAGSYSYVVPNEFPRVRNRNSAIWSDNDDGGENVSGALNAGAQTVTVPLPVSLAGDLLLLLVRSHGTGDTVATPAGWTLEDTWGDTVTFPTSWLFSKKSQAEFEVDLAANPATTTTGFATFCWAIQNGETVEITTTAASLGSGDPDPPNHDSTTTDDALWIAACAVDATDEATVTAPTSYGNLINRQPSGTTTFTCCTAERLLLAEDENPAVFDFNTNPASVDISAATIKVIPTNDAPAATATGTIKATGVVVFGRTDAAGQVSASRTFSVDQAVRIRAAKTGYKALPTGSSWINDVVDNVNGLAKTMQMQDD